MSTDETPRLKSVQYVTEEEQREITNRSSKNEVADQNGNDS